MKSCLVLACFLAAMVLPASAMSDQYRTGVLVHMRASQSPEGKNCVTLTLLVENLVFVAQQCATLPWNAYVPAEFTEQGDVQLRVEEDKLLLRRPNGKDLRARIVRRALLRTRVDLDEFWRRNSADRVEGTAPPLAEPSMSTSAAIHN